MNKDIIEIRNFSATYGDLRVLRQLNLTIKENEAYAILGPSGCGKTTFLYALAELLPLTCHTDGSIARLKALTVSTVLQDFGLFPWKTVLENTLLPLTLKGQRKPSDVESARVMLKRLKLDSHENHYPFALSGGQKQRVAIGRSWLTSPDLLLLDEPFSSLDALTRESLQEEVLVLYQKAPLTIVIVTHSIEEAVFMGKTIIILSQKGEIKAQLNNPSFGLENAREHEIFYSQCLEIRRLMKEQADEGQPPRRGI